jgi:hypothetical protein
MDTNQTPSGGGFYAGLFHQGELEALQRSLGASLSGEIDMLRVVMRRVFNRLIEEADDLKAWVAALTVLSAASQRLAGLLRTDQQLGEGRVGVGSALSQALSEVLKEMEVE